MTERDRHFLELAEQLRLSTERLRAGIELSRLEARARMLERIARDDPEWADFLAGHPELLSETDI